MKIQVRVGRPVDARDDVLVLPVAEGESMHEEVGFVDRKLRGQIADILQAGSFTGKAESLFVILPNGLTSARRVVLVGLGPKEKITTERIRRASGAAARKARELRARGLTSTVHLYDGGAGVEAAVRAEVEGVLLGLYEYRQFKSDPPGRQPETLTIVVSQTDERADAERGVKIAEALCRGVAHVRDLGNLPATTCTPSYMAKAAQDVAHRHGLTCKIIEKGELERLGMGGLLGVGRGSEEPPKFILLEYEGPTPASGKGKRAGARKPVVLVGKGVTFDSGGLDLKTADGMLTMKGDKLGAAAVIHTLGVAADLRIPLRVIGLAPCAENMPSGTSYKPGDVLKIVGGTTVEVNNTDAEGRLLLADALAYAAKKLDPAAVFDMATLTGAVSIALGEGICAGLMGTDQQLVDAVKAAGSRSGERVWELPLWDEYYDLNKSDIADLKNSPGRYGGTIAAGAFLARFTGGLPWAHVDIANMSWTDKDHPYQTKGATGYGVRLFTQLLMDLAADGAVALRRSSESR